MSNRVPGHYWVVYGTERVVAQYRYLIKSTPCGTTYREGIWFLPGSSEPLSDDDFKEITKQPLDDGLLPVYRLWGFWLSVIAMIISVVGIILRVCACK